MKARGINKVIGCMSGTEEKSTQCTHLLFDHILLHHIYVKMQFMCFKHTMTYCVHIPSSSLTHLVNFYLFQLFCCGIEPRSHLVWFQWRRTMTGCTQCWKHQDWTMWLWCRLILIVSRKTHIKWCLLIISVWIFLLPLTFFVGILLGTEIKHVSNILKIILYLFMCSF